jgi:hypothetical protein
VVAGTTKTKLIAPPISRFLFPSASIIITTTTNIPLCHYYSAPIPVAFAHGLLRDSAHHYHDYLALQTEEGRPATSRRTCRHSVRLATAPIASLVLTPYRHESGIKKEELIGNLDTHLRANSSKYADDKNFAEFYERGGSPVKKGRPAASEGDAKAAPRRRTIAPKPEPGSP